MEDFMKKIALPFALIAMIGLQACDQQTSAPAEEAEVGLETQEQRMSYGMALGLGQRLAAEDLPIDIDAFAAGISDAITGAEPRLTQEEITAELTAYQEQAMAKQAAEQAEAGTANQAAGEAFLAENAARDDVVVTATGLQYEIVEAGDGASPGADDTVEVHYRGTLIDGTEFDSSYGRGETVTFGVGQVIPGWTEALQLMPMGSTWKLYIPSDLGYGSGGAGQMIGPNSALVFDVELIAIPSQADDSAAE
ncbi:MAG: FKBP-type peptidyl-prolyl cis-trans isomerase [Alcanivorax sp.]|jgi:FKBP-type peptidyl-prolyl cis-trans isomerase